MIDALSQRFPGFEDWAIVIFPLSLIAYFVPVLVAVARRHRYVSAITLINALVGWTVLGWFGAMIWAVNKDISESPDSPEVPAKGKGSEAPREPIWKDIEPVFAASAPPVAPPPQDAKSIEKRFEELQKLLHDHDGYVEQKFANEKAPESKTYAEFLNETAKGFPPPEAKPEPPRWKKLG